MRIFLIFAVCFALVAQTPKISVKQIQSSSTPVVNAVPYVTGSQATQYGYDSGRFFWDPTNFRLNLAGALFTGLTGGGTQIVKVDNSGIVGAVAGNSVLTPPVTFTDISTPAAPSAGTTKWYTKNGAMCSESPTGVETCTGTGGGSTTFGGLGNGAVTRTSSTVLTIDAACTASTPCPVWVGDTTYIITTSATATISAGSPTAYIYIDGSGTRSVGVATGTVTCSGCTTTGVSSFPAGVVKYATWTATTGTWNIGGYQDERAPLGIKPNTVAGTGLTAAGNTLSVDTTVIAPLSAPALVNATCTGSCTGFGATSAISYPLMPSCDPVGGVTMTIWNRQTTNATSFFCPNNNDTYQGALVSYSAANTNVASVNVPVPPWWTSGAVTLTLQVFGEAGAGNIQFKAATYCAGAGTVYGSGQTYNGFNNTNTATAPTALNRVVLTATLTTTGCSANNIMTIKVQQGPSNTWSAVEDIAGGFVTFN